MYSRQMALRQQCRHPNGEVAEITLAEISQTVHARFSRMATTFPDKAAFFHAGQTTSYAEIERMSNGIAWVLGDQPDQGNEPVALLLQAGAGFCAANLGITKAGLCYSALPVENPAERLRYILADLGARLLVTDRHNLPAAEQLVGNGIRLVLLEDLLTGQRKDALSIDGDGDSLHSIRYTSGSTGRPKGVMTTHGQILHDARARFQTMQLCPADRIVGFSASYAIAVISFLAGATYYELDLRQSGAASVYQRLIENAMTVLNCKVTTFRQLMRSADPARPLSQLRIVRLTGEPPTPADLQAAAGIVPDRCVFTNQYGSTESHIGTTFYATAASLRAKADFPAGYPVEGAEVLLLDKAGQPVATGEEGEIVIRSPAVCSGYWRLPAQTQERFSQGQGWRQYATGDWGRLDVDGCLHYLGRKDDQVKIRSHRVRLTEVEAMLLGVEGVAAGAVVARPGPNGDLRLIGYIVPARPNLTVSELRLALQERLPVAMIPAVFVFLQSLPQTASGKVDRMNLPDPGRHRPALDRPFVAAVTPFETAIQSIWAEVLGFDEIGVEDNFLELGGNSLLASQIVTRVLQTLQIELPLAALFAEPTVRDMALAAAAALLDGMPADLQDGVLPGAGNAGHLSTKSDNR